MLRERYAFDVFAKNSDQLRDYRAPTGKLGARDYQVGDLVSTIPLAPKEIRCYTTRKVTKRTRATKELEDQLQTRRTESSNRACESRSSRRRRSKTNFKSPPRSRSAVRTLAGRVDPDLRRRAGQASERAKRDFRENVLKSAQEYRPAAPGGDRHERKQGDRGDDFPRDPEPERRADRHLSVYELQRTYRISERIHSSRRSSSWPTMCRARTRSTTRGSSRTTGSSGGRSSTTLSVLRWITCRQLRRRGSQHPPPRGERARAQERRPRS